MIKLIKSIFYNEKETKKKLAYFIKRTGRLSFGRECEEFERSFAGWQGRKYCRMFNSGSSANFSLIQALLNLKRLRKGEKVGFSAVTWATNVMPLMELGLSPVPIDVEIETLNVSSRSFKSAAGRHRLGAAFLTNLLGFCGDIDRIERICREENIILLEDNCESLGSEYKGRKLGNFGLASTFSFYVGHHMSTIEGGAVCTDDEELSIMLALVRAHGWDRNLSSDEKKKIRGQSRRHSDFYDQYTFYDLGYNFRPTEIQGFLGKLQLKFLPSIVKKRQENFKKLSKAIHSRSDLYYPVRYEHMDVVSNFAFPVVCRSGKTRDRLLEKCEGEVEVRPVVAGNVVEQPFFGKYLKEKEPLPSADIIHGQGLYFGNNPELTEAEIKKIIGIFTSV